MEIIVDLFNQHSGNVDELKRMWRLADAVLRNGNVYYICNGIIDAEFKEIK